MEVNATMWVMWPGKVFTNLFAHDVFAQVPQYVVTRDAVSFPDHMAQYVLAVILARERHLIEHHHNQQVRLW